MDIVDLKLIFLEFEHHLLNDNKPSEYFNSMIQSNIFKVYPFNMLYNLVNTEQAPTYHPEGSVWNHTMMVVDGAASVKEKSQNKKAFMWAALLHDIGKAPTTKLRKGKITSYDHDKVGMQLSKQFLESLTEDKELIEDVSKLIKWHMQPLYTQKNLPFGNIKLMMDDVDYNEVALLSLCDRLGRGGMTIEKGDIERKNLNFFIKKCEKVK